MLKNKQTSKWLKKCIKEYGQRKNFAKALGVNPALISYWKNNPITLPPLKKIIKIEEVTQGKVTADEIFMECKKFLLKQKSEK